MSMTVLDDVAARLNDGECLRQSAVGGTGAGAFAISRHADLFVAGSDGVIRCTRIRDAKLNRADHCRVIETVQATLPRQLVSLAFNATGEALAAVSFDEVHIVFVDAREVHGDGPLTCDAVCVVGRDTSAAIPPAEVVMIRWHPLSHEHIGVLFADNTFRLFRISSAGAALEEEVRLLSDERALTSRAQFPGFCFGESSGWERFSVYFLHESGDIFTLCPIVPRHAVISAADFGLYHSMAVASDNPFVSAWLDEFWHVRSSDDAMFYARPDDRAPNEFVVVAQDAVYRHADGVKGARYSSVLAVSSPSLPVTVLFTASDAGDVDTLVGVDSTRPRWRENGRSTDPELDGNDSFQRLARTRSCGTELLGSDGRSSIFAASTDGIVRIDTSDLNQFLARCENGEDRAPLPCESFPVDMVVSIPRSQRLGGQPCRDSLVGDFLFVLDRSFTCRLLPLCRGVPEERGQLQLVLKSGPTAGFETFALEEFKVDPELSLSLAALQGFQTVSISSLDDSASLQGFLEFSSIADRCIDACHRVSVAVQARISLLDKFDRIQKLYLSRVQTIIGALANRDRELHALVRQRVEAGNAVCARIANCAECIRRSRLLLEGEGGIISAEERDFAKDVEAVTATLNSLRASYNEMSERAHRTLKACGPARERNWMFVQSFSSLGEAHSARIKPALEQHTTALQDCKRRLRQLQSRLNTEFPDLV
ncbi:Nucleoporin Nup133/Nup155-like N-terminal domain-containing protein [Plasmodiophora brassicae]